MSEDRILFRVQGALGRITLNRPQALNALDHAMCEAIRAQLAALRDDPHIQAVVIDAVPGRAFCAGGDVRAVYHLGREGISFFAEEYRMNGAVKHFAKPYIALMDGIVMGGGAGVSIHGSFRVATENTLFAMPEIAIGLFPDVGASYFLTRLPDYLGYYLGLTASRIRAADLCLTGLATHYIPATRHPEILRRLESGEAAHRVLDDLAEDPGEAPLVPWREAIARSFSATTVEDILARLASEGDWGRATIEIMRGFSPTSLKLTLRELREGAGLDFDACQRMEFGIASRALAGHDFYEGVRTTLIDRGERPLWSPDRIEAVQNAAIAAYFVPLDVEF